ncbi:MAG: zinc ribbon domain-containing protein, partial [Desulfotomaculaceae bacterium]
MLYKKPLPQPNADTKPFWDGCKEHQLKFQKCLSCGYVRGEPSVICPQCHSAETTWMTSTGKGKVYTFTVFHMAYHRGFVDDIPYVTAL